MDIASTIVGRKAQELTIDTIIFDFDGTVALGDGPVRAVASAAAAMLDANIGRALLRRVHEALDLAARDGFPEGVLDGYDLVRRFALDAGLGEPDLDRAYRESRALLGGEHAPIHAPAGLRDFLRALPSGVQAVLVTNAPATRVPEAVEALGLSGCFASIHTDAAKPDGLEALASRWSDGRILSVGDIWRNDLEPIARIGGHTAYVGPISPVTHAADYAASHLEDLLPDLARWASPLP